MNSPLLPPKQSTSVDELELAAYAGDPFSQNLLGARIASGNSDAFAQSVALYWYAAAVLQGHTHAKWNAATMLLAGEGLTAPRIPEALLLARSAAANGHTISCSFLADCYEKELFGIRRDPTMEKLFREKATQLRALTELSEPIDMWSMEVDLPYSRPIGAMGRN